MENQAIDPNDIGTWTAYNDATGNIERVRVDPVTNALLVYAVTWDGNTPTSLNNTKIDANDKATEIGLDDTTGLIEAFRCGTDGSLLVVAE